MATAKKRKTTAIERAVRALQREARSVQKQDWSLNGTHPGMNEERDRYVQGVEESLRIVLRFAKAKTA